MHGSVLFAIFTVVCIFLQGFFEGDGGGIYNRGAIVVEGESLFTENTASVSSTLSVSVDSIVFLRVRRGNGLGSEGRIIV